MAHHHHRFLALSFIALALLLVVSKCSATYPLFNELQIPQRPTKFVSKNDVDHYVNRLKQYYETMAHLRHWRRDIDLSDEQDDDTLQDRLRQYENLAYKR